jgi:hypothetical protein
VENGVIPVPLQYRGTLSDSVRVLVFPKPSATDTSETVAEKQLYSLSIDMTGFTFDRNEINER